MSPMAHEILGILNNADEHTIKEAHRRLVMKYHPDLHPSGDERELANGIMASINVARDEMLRIAAIREKHMQQSKARADSQTYPPWVRRDSGWVYTYGKNPTQETPEQTRRREAQEHEERTRRTKDRHAEEQRVRRWLADQAVDQEPQGRASQNAGENNLYRCSCGQTKSAKYATCWKCANMDKCECGNWKKSHYPECYKCSRVTFGTFEGD